MRACVIFNPAAKGDKARRFRRRLDEIGSRIALKLTTGPGDARRLAAEAVEEGFEIVAAAGGDGTVNEVLNGVGDAPGGFERARLAVLPLGTVNVFARELAIPRELDKALGILSRGREIQIDLPAVEYAAHGSIQRRYFAQLAGAGLDARAVELVNWELKKKLGPLAYVLAGLKALAGPAARISAESGEKAAKPEAAAQTHASEVGAARNRVLAKASPEATASGGRVAAAGALVLVGNGKLYGGEFRVFPQADLQDGLLEVCVFPKLTWLTLARCSGPLLLKGTLPASAVQIFQTERLQLSGATRTPLEVDGELIGELPASFSVERKRLRVLVANGG